MPIEMMPDREPQPEEVLGSSINGGASAVTRARRALDPPTLRDDALAGTR